MLFVFPLLSLLSHLLNSRSKIFRMYGSRQRQEEVCSGIVSSSESEEMEVPLERPKKGYGSSAREASGSGVVEVLEGTSLERSTRVESGKKANTSEHLVVASYLTRCRYPRFHEEADSNSKLASYLHRTDGIGGPLNSPPDKTWDRHAVASPYHRVVEDLYGIQSSMGVDK